MITNNWLSTSAWLKALHYLNILGFYWIIFGWTFQAIPGRWAYYGGLYVFFITWLIEVVVEKRWRSVRWDKRTLYFLLPILFFSLALLYAPFDTDTNFKWLLERRYGLAGFGLVGLLGMNREYSLHRVFCFLIVLAIGAIIYIAYRAGGWHWLMSEHRAELFSAARVHYVNAHTQFNYLLCLTLIAIWYLLFREQKRPRWWGIILYVSAALVILYSLSLSEGRTGFLAGFFLVGLLCVMETWRYRRWMGAVMMVMALTLFSVVVAHHSRMSKDKLQGEPRLVFWQAAEEPIKARPLLGYGMSRAQEEFTRVFIEKVPEDYQNEWRNHIGAIDSHNQYIQTQLEFGMIGLLLLLAIYLLPILIDTQHRLLTVMMIGLSMFQSVFNTFMTGDFCIIFCVLLLILLMIDRYNQPIEKEEVCA